LSIADWRLTITIGPVVHVLLRRALAALILIWVVASCGFALAALAPGDIADVAGGIGASPAQIAEMRREAGLDRPLVVQYGRWLRRLVRGDLGTSFLYRAPVGPMVLDRAINTAILATTALLLALAMGLPPAVLCATRPHSIAARAVRAISLLLLSIPPFVGALALVFVAARTGWLPAGGMTGGAELTGVHWLADVLWHLPLPALALALPLAATFERQQTTALTEALATPAVQAARARGVGKGQIVRRHAWRLSLKPVLALGGLAMAALLGGAFVVETIAAWPGLGRLTYDAMRARDIPLVAGCALAGSTVLAIGLFVSDVLVAWADPRVRD
jgi:peptide/nickel transport system permease protein